MRNLVLLRGCPGAGKSTFIEENNLENYTLSPDKIRVMAKSPVLLLDGTTGISQSSDTVVWKILFTLLEERMKKGDFTIIDATHTKRSDYLKYKDLSDHYRYRVYCLDFSDVPLETALERNKQRPAYKHVPEEVIRNMYARYETQQLPSFVKKIKPEEFHEVFNYKPHDLSHYKKIHHIGDIHGCVNTIKEYIDERGGFKDDEFYVFLGDYIDRGPMSAETIDFLYKIRNKENVILLEGNHEYNMWLWANGAEEGMSREFNEKTRIEFENKHVSKKKVRELYRTFAQAFLYKYNNKIMLCSHGGLSTIPENLLYVSAKELIRGTGNYNDNIDEAFTKNVLEKRNLYQIHGHRNNMLLDTISTERSFNLNDTIEYGGSLRIVTLTKYGFVPFSIKNNDIAEDILPTRMTDFLDDKDVIAFMMKHPLIRVKQLTNYISALQFKPEVFYDKTWDELNSKARGLFIKHNTRDIVARSYDKFFYIGERNETKLPILKNNLKFPLTAYVKYNGFLGIVSYDDINDDLFFASKSEINSPNAKWLKEIFYEKVSDENARFLKDFLKDNNCSVVFEVLDSVNDSHIIDIEGRNIILLDIIKNTTKFEKSNYEALKNLAENIGLQCKEKAFNINTFEDLVQLKEEILSEDYKHNGEFIEGFVIEDQNNFMFKMKTGYYIFWKRMRSIIPAIRYSRQNKISGGLLTPEANKFEAFLRTLPLDDLSKNICELRKMYQNKYNNKKNN